MMPEISQDHKLLCDSFQAKYSNFVPPSISFTLRILNDSTNSNDITLARYKVLPVVDMTTNR